MINRVLIRMKTVQLLYSYLLVEKPFALESQPSNPTKEKRFAYNLYLDLIYLIDRLAHQVSGKKKSYPLSDTRFVLKTEGDEIMKGIQKKYSEETYPFHPAELNLRDAIKESLLFKEFEKKKTEGLEPDNFWENVFRAIIFQDSQMNEIIKTLPNYSLSGVERMKTLMDETFRNFYSSQGNIDESIRTLKKSMQTARDLYMRLLALPVELTKLRLSQLEQNRAKLLATTEDLNPNMRFVNNRLPGLIEKDKIFAEYIDSHHLSWLNEDPELLNLLLKAVITSPVYEKYEKEQDPNLEKDADFWKDTILDVILDNEDFLEYLENKSVFWNDDLEIITSFVLKTIKRFENKETGDSALLPMYKDGEDGRDAKFGEELFRYVVKNKEIYKQYLEEVLKEEKWAPDRLAFMDVVVTMTALAEIINYPEIPLAVSVNEYVEIAKSYSSEKSGQFVHGLLASLIKKLKSDGVIIKQ